MAAPPIHSNLHERASREKPYGITKEGYGRTSNHSNLHTRASAKNLAALPRPGCEETVEVFQG